MAQQSILDARLAEIDRRLRTIQSGLAQGDEPAGSAAGAGAAAPDVPSRAPLTTGASPLADELDEARRLVAGLQELTAAHQRLLTSSRELLSTFSETLAGSGPGALPSALGLAAGPFADTAALRRFSEGLAALPEVRAVTVREYTGTDRVIIDVHLWGPTS